MDYRNPTPKGKPTRYTLGEFASHIEALPDDKEEAELSWTGGDTLEACLKYARFGWPAGTKKAMAKVNAIADRLISKTASGVIHTVAYDVVGGAYDAGAVSLGLPEAWGYLEPQETKRAIRIVSNVCTSGGVRPEAMLERGIAVSALCLALNAYGYPLTVDVTQGSLAGKPIDYVRLADASSGSPLDIDRLVFALSHPGMFRHLFRAHVNEHRNAIQNTHDVWGPSHVDADSPINDGDTIDLFFGGQHLRQVERWGDGGEAWILEQFHKQTGV